jgi:arginase
MNARSFDFALSYPQWQGSGRNENLLRGALAAAKVCGRYAPLAQVPLAGEGEAVGGIHRWTSILEQFCSAQSLLAERRPRRILTAGGDCAVDIAVIDYLHQAYPDLTVVWVDAHLDANRPETSPSGSFHGMPVAAIMGLAPMEMRNLVRHPLSPPQFRYVAADVGDDGDWEFQRMNGLKWLQPDDPISGPIHIHFDLDVLDPAEFPYLSYPEGNMCWKAALDLVGGLADRHELVGLTITEFSPANDSEALEGSRFIENLCEVALNSPARGSEGQAAGTMG